MTRNNVCSYLIVLDVAVGRLQQILPFALDVLGAREPWDELGPAGARQLQVLVLNPGSVQSRFKEATENRQGLAVKCLFESLRTFFVYLHRYFWPVS